MAADVHLTRAASWAARVLAVLDVSLVATGVALPLIGDHDYLPQLLGTPEAVIGVSFAVLGGFLAGRPPARGMGWFLLAVGTFAAAYVASVSWVAFLLEGDPDRALPAGAESIGLAAAWVANWTWFPVWVLVATALPLLLPDGGLPGRLWRAPLFLALAATSLGVLELATSTDHLAQFRGLDNPLASRGLAHALTPVWPVLDVMVPMLALVGLVSMVVRFRGAGPVQRRQLGWVGYGVGLAVLAAVALGPLDAPAWMVNLAVLFVPAGIAMAALRHRLYDLDLVVNRTLVAALLVAGAALVYAAAVGWLGALLGTSSQVESFVGAFLVALAFHPARVFVQRQVDRLFFGRRGDPYALLRDLDRTLREAISPREALLAAAGRVRGGLRLSGIRIDVPMPAGADFSADEGELEQPSVELSLELHGEPVGALRAGARGGFPLSDTDVRVLGALAGPIASAAYALVLSADLEQSHGRLVTAREEERRRLRRDLHDGLGPQLAGVVMGTDSVRNAIARGDSCRAEELSRMVGEQARSAVDDVRRLVFGLRPPVLDDLGLSAAIRTLGPALAPDGPSVRVDVKGGLSELPAAVEVAAYRIAAEALTNAVRHSGATTVDITVAVAPEALTVRVCDDGTGIPVAAVAGVGLQSMRERATELGGWCHVSTAEPHGTCVHAHLPLEPE